MTTRAAELARKAGWPYWSQDGEPQWTNEANPIVDFDATPWVDLDPEHDLDHALALAECRWPAVDFTLMKEVFHGGTGWSFELMSPGYYGSGAGSTPALAICAALDAAGEKE